MGQAIRNMPKPKSKPKCAARCFHAVELPRRAADDAIAQQSGSIVNISSIATRSIHRIPYAAAKGGVNAMSMSLAMEHAVDSIRVDARGHRRRRRRRRVKCRATPNP